MACARLVTLLWYRACWKSRKVAEEAGIALVLALLVLVVLGVAISATVDYSVHQSQSSAEGGSRADAVALAESGVNLAADVLSNPTNDPTNSSTLPSAASPGSLVQGAGTAYYWGTYDSSSMTWTVYGQGSVRNPSATQPVTHQVSEQFVVTQGGSSSGAWGYMFASAPSGCVTVPNGVTIQEPLYVNGNLCLTGSGTVAASASPVSVAGTIQTSSSSTTVGTAANPVAQLHVGGGCRLGSSGSFVTPCSAAQYVYATAQDTNVPSISKPTLDLASWYANAQPGPSHACTTGSFPGGFDNNTALDTSLPTITLTPSSAYSCTVSSGGTTIGKIAWTPGSPGTLTIQGTVFFDGSISMTGGTSMALYQGRGTIYTSGTFTMANSAELCGAYNYASSTCDWTNWNPSTNLLIIVAGSSSTPDVSLTGNTRFQGGVYANTTYSQGNSVQEQGPIIGNSITLSGATIGGPGIGTVPSGAPGGTYGVSVVPGTWRG
jgi:Tfp pilus assembly protein PilX